MFFICESVDGDAFGAEGAEGVAEEAAAGEDDDAGTLELLGEDGGGAKHFGLGLGEVDVFVEDAFVVRLGAGDDFFHHVDALEGVEAGGGFAGEHDGIGALADGVGDVRDFGAGGHGGGDHRLEEVSGDDDGLALGEAGLDNLGLDLGEAVVIDLDAEIATGDHNGIGFADDFLEVADAGLVFDFRDDAGIGVEAFEEVLEVADVLAFAGEGEGEEIGSGGDAGTDVAAIFFGEGWEVDIDAGEIDVATGAEAARGEDAAVDGGFVFGDDFETHEAAIDEHHGADGDVGREAGVVDIDAADGLCGGFGVEGEGFADGEVDGFGDWAGADFGALDVHHDGDVAIDACGDFADAADALDDPIASGVGHVEADDIDAGEDEFFELLRALGGRAESCDDFSVPKIASRHKDGASASGPEGRGGSRREGKSPKSVRPYSGWMDGGKEEFGRIARRRGKSG